MNISSFNRTSSIIIVGLAIWMGYWPSQSYADSGEELDSSQLTADSAILIEAGSGITLFEKNADRQMYPASITKIITAMVALESSELSEIVTVSKEARNEDGTRVYLSEGEQLTMERLLYALLLNSGNDAATAIAEHIDGSKEEFAERMNDYVKNQVGIYNTINKNPSGLPDPEHVTTARDMSKIAQVAMQNRIFRTIVSTKNMPWQGEEWQSSLVNHNKLLWSYEGITGIKNGYTTEAGSTLVASARRDGMELIGVVLKSANSKTLYEDMTKLLDYGFNNFMLKPVFTVGQIHLFSDGIKKQEFIANSTIYAAVRKEESPVFSVGQDGLISLENELGKQVIGQMEEVINETSYINESKDSVQSSPPIFKYFVFIMWLLMNIFLGLIGYLLYTRKRRRRRKGRSN